MPECVGEQRNPFVDLNVHLHPSGAYITDLGRDWEGLYAAKRSGATRKRERRQMRQLAQFGKLTFVDVAGPDERTRTLTPLFEQKIARLRPHGRAQPLPEARATRVLL